MFDLKNWNLWDLIALSGALGFLTQFAIAASAGLLMRRRTWFHEHARITAWATAVIMVAVGTMYWVGALWVLVDVTGASVPERAGLAIALNALEFSVGYAVAAGVLVYFGYMLSRPDLGTKPEPELNGA